MHKPDPVETILARLMPPALSEDSQRAIENMLQALAAAPGPVVIVAPPPREIHWRYHLGTAGIAAAGVAAAWFFPMAAPLAPSSWAVAHPAAATPAGLVLVSESDRVEAMTDEGWQENADGSTMQALRLSVVEENSLLDEETGIVMQISEPREELFLMPVSTF